MNNDKQLDRYLALCRDIYERRVRVGDWPWEKMENEIISQPDTS